MKDNIIHIDFNGRKKEENNRQEMLENINWLCRARNNLERVIKEIECYSFVPEVKLAIEYMRTQLDSIVKRIDELRSGVE